MFLRLHPQGTGLGPIEVDESLFTIGRGEGPFAHVDKSLVARLSRRHAKIFLENGAVYVADLNSRNGTLVNGQRVSAVPRQLADGDELEVGKLQFRIEFCDVVSSQSPSESEVVVLLEPVSQGLQRAPIVVTRFPFLIQRDSELFAPYLDRVAEQVEFISAKHAHLYLQNGQVYLEDLDSTNGTLLNDAKLSNQPQTLKNGDTIAFGGDFFDYRVHILRQNDSADRTVIQEFKDAQGADGTIIVDSPTSFIDIFDTQDSPSQAPDGEQSVGVEMAVDAPSSDALEAQARERAIDRDRGVAPDKRDKPKHDPVAANRGTVGRPRGDRKVWRYATVGIVVAAVAYAIWSFFRQPSIDELERHVYAGDYAQASRIAKSIVQGGGADAGAMRLAMVAILRANVPGWVDAYQRRDGQGTAQVIDELRVSARFLPELNDYVQLLEWSEEARSALESPTTGRGEFARLRRWWTSDLAARKRALERLSGYVPEPPGLVASIAAQARELESR